MSQPVRSYKDLIVWQKSMDLVADVYRVTQHFPKEEIYGLTSQIRRAAVSIPSNIAEGQGRLTRGEFRQSLGHSRGSLFETETQLLIAERLDYVLDPEPLLDRTAEIGRLLNGLLNSLPTNH